MPPNTPTVETLEYTAELADASGVQAALDAAVPHVEVVETPAAGHSVVVVAYRNDRTVAQLDLERYLTGPTRARGTLQVFTADGFVTAYRQRTFEDDPDGNPGPTVSYADPDRCRLVAVLNDDHPGSPGWRDHRIELTLKPTPEWELWSGGQGLGSQEHFAEVIEAGEKEIVDPSPTVMLDIAQTFHASMGAKIKRANRLRDGRTQFVYDEDIEASAGAAGELTIPDKFTIRVRPFYGAQPVDVECRLRYRVDRGGAFVIGYTMDRADEVRRESFATDVLGQVREAIPNATIVEGVPGEPTQAGR